MNALRQMLLCAWIAMCMISQAYGQLTTATVTGTVTDASGAAIPGASLTLENLSRGATRTAVADTAGRFSFDFVQVGTYRLTVSQTGFATGTRSGLELVSGQVIDLPMQLAVQQQTTSVEVQANAAQLETTEAQQVATLNEAQVHELPVAHLDWSNLVAYAAGTTKPPYTSSLNSTSPAGSGENVNGLPSAGYNFMVDGTNAGNNATFPAYNPYQGVALINAVNNDAIQELSVAKGTPPAIVGNAVAASINIITKSGTNAFHGSAHELNEVSAYDARNQFLTYRPNTVFNDYGGSLGGPILKNKLFFFGSYEQASLATAKPINGTVPSPYLRSIAPAVYAPLFALFPVAPQPANPTATSAQYFGAGTNTQRDKNGVFRGDYYINSNNMLAVHYVLSRPYAFSPALLAANPRTYVDNGNAVSVAYTHTSARWTEDTRVAFNSIGEQREDKLLSDPNFGNINFGWNSAGSKAVNWPGSYTTGQEAVSFVHGRQSIQFGGIVERQRLSNTQFAPTTINYSNLTQFLNNAPATIQLQLVGDPATGKLPDGSPYFLQTRFQYGAYIQDDVKLLQNLTLNLGARYDYFTVPTELKNRIFNRGGIDPARPFLGPGFGPIVNQYYNPDRSAIQPRIGLAYNISGKGKTVLRAGFAKMAMGPTYYSTVAQDYGLGPSIPFQYLLNTGQTAASGLKYPINSSNYVTELTRLQASGVASTNLPVGNSTPLHYPNPYSLQWMFGIQQALPWRMTLETDYNGNRGLDESSDYTVNLQDRITGVAPNPTQGGQNLNTPYGRSKYASLQITLRKALSNGLNFSTAFTYARVSAVGSGDLVQGGGPQDIYNRLADWGPAGFDIKLRSVTTAIWELPLARWTRATGHASKLLLDGWQLSGVFTGQTGLPANVTNNLSATGSDRPNACGCGVPTYLSGYQTGLDQYLNPAAFISVPLSPLSGRQIAGGNLSYNAVRQPGTVNLDASLSKTFALTERFRLRLRADTFNTLNHTNLFGLVTTTGTSTFGRLTQATARTMQLEGRLIF